MTLLGAVGGGCLDPFRAAENNAILKLDALTLQCIRTSSSSTCQKALTYAEVLQRNAAAQGNYGCQTRLLGLQADLLMIGFKTVRTRSALLMLKEAKSLCKRL